MTTQKETNTDHIFCGVYPGGIVYADRTREEHGDYKRLAFLPYKSLEIQFNPDASETNRALVREMAAHMQAMRGQRFEISTCGQSVMLGA